MKTISRNTAWKDKLTLASIDSQTHPNSVRIRYAYGSILVMEKGLNEKEANVKKPFLQEGIRQLTAAVKILPDYSDAWFNLGMGYKELEDYKNSIICFDNARKYMAKEYPEIFIESGVAYGQDGQYDKAFELLKKAIQLDSSSADAYNNIGLFYSWEGNFPLSLKMLNKAKLLNPKDDHPFYNLGNTYEAMEDFKTAIEYYHQALSINSQSDITWLISETAMQP
ncbi:MAG: tetratricopeptide repeat protein [Chitinophagales bacterium]